jgi:YHS domain-containing protein
MNLKLCLFALLLGLGMSSNSVIAQNEKIYNVDESGRGIKGYDPVAYQQQKAALEGKKEIQASYKGVKYYFYSLENKNLFLKNPERFEPAYGGWCAYAMGAYNGKVEVDPETYKVIDGRTYLFYNFYFNNTLKSWNKDESKLKTNADKNWSKIIAKP